MGAALQLRPGETIGWRPMPSGQTLYLTCPAIQILGEGNRGGGKTETALVDYARDVGRWGGVWRGVIFARKYKQLDDVVAKAKRLFRKISPEARFLASKSDYKFVWPTGEELLLRIGNSLDDYWEYHGQEFPFIHFEELTRWPDDTFYEAMQSCNRCSTPGVRLRYSGTTNPFGPGHHWVKELFIKREDGTPIPAHTIIRTHSRVTLPTGEVLAVSTTRARIHIDLFDNKALIENDPAYLAKLSKIGNTAMRAAWLEGDWDIEVGGFLQGVWNSKRHAVAPFPIPYHWPRWRALDWGYAAPYSVGWYTRDPDGVIFRYRELYGYGGKPNTGSRETVSEVAARIKEAEAKEAAKKCEFRNNPADPSIWSMNGGSRSPDGRDITIGKLFADEGIRWTPAKTGPGSRVSGAQVVIDGLKRDNFRVFKTCKHWLRTVPVLMPDDNNWEDVDTESEDHAWDETRYSLVSRHRQASKDAPVQEAEPAIGSMAWLEKYDTGNRPAKRSAYRR